MRKHACGPKNVDTREDVHRHARTRRDSPNHLRNHVRNHVRNHARKHVRNHVRRHVRK